ncbi:hypothetical protein MSA03_22890 [Microbacterium saccharophilum]|nr:hypothetical protein MSA03_22890 [Microbacterium saccharophilum]
MFASFRIRGPTKMRSVMPRLLASCELDAWDRGVTLTAYRGARRPGLPERVCGGVRRSAARAVRAVQRDDAE